MPHKSIVKFFVWVIPLYILFNISDLLNNTIDVHLAIWASFVLSFVIVVLLFKLKAVSDKETLTELKSPQSPGGFVVPILKLWSVTLFFGIALLSFSICIYINYSFHEESAISEKYHVFKLLNETNSSTNSFGVIIKNKENIVKVNGISIEIWSKLEVRQPIKITIYHGLLGLNIFKPGVSEQISNNINITNASKWTGVHIAPVVAMFTPAI